MQQLNDQYHVFQKDNFIEFRFVDFFDQDDIANLAAKLLKKIQGCTLIEQIEGIDRAYFRCRIDHEHNPIVIQLHFETYSQSCWIEQEDGKETLINKIFQQF